MLGWLLAAAGMAPHAELAEMTFPAVAGVASLAVVEVASSTDSMEPAGSPNVCVQPVVRDGMPDTEDRHRDHEVGSTERQV